MKRLCILIAFLCGLTSQSSLAIICETTIMENKQAGKTIVCLSDIHEQYFLNEQSRPQLEELIRAQKEQMLLIANLINTSNNDHDQATLFITETPPTVIANMIDDFELDRSSNDNDAVFHVAPKALLAHILSDAISNNNIAQELTSKLQKFDDMRGCGFHLDNNARWIIADTLRTNIDNFLALEAYSHWKQVKEVLVIKQRISTQLQDYTFSSIKKYLQDRWLSFKTKLGLTPNIREDIEQLTIAFLIEYLSDLNKRFNAHNLPSQDSFDTIMHIVNEALETDQVQLDSHVVELHEYLINKNQSSKRDLLNNNVIIFISLKFDLELATYLENFNNIESEKNIIFTVGADHAQVIKEFADKNNYQLVSSCGLPDDLLDKVYNSTSIEHFNEIIAKLPSQAPIDQLSKIIKRMYA